ncbi:MAG TPA: acireductone synthase [Candidatus Acidoferrum sp.]|nr:acireductone synthase [Candidatus Acidoferrum sp.]
MAAPSGEDSIQAILLDIEGTTTPIDFVFRTLFPYARKRMQQFLLAHGNEPGIREDVDALRQQHRADAAEQLNPPAWVDDPPGAELTSAAAYGVWLIDRDSKCSALKSLQGKIWQEGYRTGELRGEVYPDVPAALARWSRQGKIICIFSSGSVLAQKLLFTSSTAGDLTGFLRAYFDTTAGPKNAPKSYLRIAEALTMQAPKILFISDVAKELDAARETGMQTALCVRTQSPERISSAHRVVNSFQEILA